MKTKMWLTIIMIVEFIVFCTLSVLLISKNTKEKDKTENGTTVSMRENNGLPEMSYNTPEENEFDYPEKSMCLTCGGTGTIFQRTPCGICGGTGFQNIWTADGFGGMQMTTIGCGGCGGTGGIHNYVICPTCSGMGYY